ncbi:ring-cleaving dioxygenase [Paenibacillus sp. PCH8]|uniref:VOC family protein n=1 Tax=Paenibacillus sp. PCH8 TaxID=2066524 RepID=UPI000CF896EE|nr:VOC family protein [Paenibacillus sp. PCH8]PQP82977.1 ring-cleaving dioxygenase [Paenibacillus sp. PCH8]
MMIEELQLYTTRLEDLKRFYRDTLGMKVSDATNQEFNLQVGRTKMIFKPCKTESEPFYHFAWMIPTNRFKQAKQWVTPRVTLSRDGSRDETYSTNWDSHSLYFEDPAGNIIELIAHHTVQNESDHDRDFTTEDILQVCEIGLVTDDVLSTVNELQQFGLARWGEGSDTFAPVGDVHGLFIVVKKERTWFFSKQKAQIYPLEVSIRDVGKLRIG